MINEICDLVLLQEIVVMWFKGFLQNHDQNHFIATFTYVFYYSTKPTEAL